MADVLSDSSCSNVTPILQVSNLSISFSREGAYHQVVSDVSFSLFRGKTLGIVGESGSGKSVSVMSLMRLLPFPQARIDSGTALFTATGRQEAVDLLSLSESQIRHFRGSRIGMVFQEPMTSLNPVQHCGYQVVEALRKHSDITAAEARKRVLDLFSEVQLPRPEKIFDSYPHEISGGQKQRVMIAMALVCNPDVIIADEPTTALDVLVQKSILSLFRSIQQKHDIGIIFITHDLGVVSQIADDVAVMYHGKIVEQGPASQVLNHPRHPYTQGLLACRPPLDSKPLRLPTVQEFLDPDHVNNLQFIDSPLVSPKAASRVPLLQVRDLSVTYTLSRNILGVPKQQLKAVDNVTFEVFKGETLGLVGGSGCGKTTLGRSLLQLIKSSSGSVLYKNRPLNELSERDLRRMRTQLQIIFQDPYSSLNPQLTVGNAIAEPLAVHCPQLSQQQRKDKVLDLLAKVGLSEDCYNRYPHEFSGGQRQRVCIARSLILNPELVVCDESVSALDVSVQAQVLNLLNQLKSQFGYTYIFITHDLSVVHYMADRILVMYQGAIVEQGSPSSIFQNPEHPYTKSLVDAIPKIKSV